MSRSHGPSSPASRLAWWHVLQRLPRETWRTTVGHRGRIAAMLGLGLLAALVLSRFEHPWQERSLLADPATALYILADYVSWWGKLDKGLAVLLLGWLALDLVGRRLAGQAAVVTVLWGQLVSGILVNLGKSGLGRARPHSGHADGFYGPTLDYAFQSFPSGHTTAAFALAATLAILHPRWAPLLAVYAALIGWSRVALHVHHPSDVLMGAVLGTVCGVVCGRAGQRIKASCAATAPARPS